LRRLGLMYLAQWAMLLLPELLDLDCNPVLRVHRSRAHLPTRQDEKRLY
jgi:hypothetical protein